MALLSQSMHGAGIKLTVKSLPTLFAPNSSCRESVSSLDPQVFVEWEWLGGPRAPNTPPTLWGNFLMAQGAG